MNLRPNRLAATLAATGVTAALVLASPMGADAAKMITGKDIKNGSISSSDIKNGSLKAKDFKKGQLPTAGPTGPAGPAGPAGKDAAQPVTAAFRAELPAGTNNNQVSAQSSAAIVPAFSQVAGVNITSSPDLATACGADGYQVSAGLGSGQSFVPLIALFKNNNTTSAQSLGLPQTSGPAATVLTVFASCNGNTNVPATSVTVTYTVAAQNTTPSTTYTGSVPVPSNNNVPFLAEQNLSKSLDR